MEMTQLEWDSACAAIKKTQNVDPNEALPEDDDEDDEEEL